MQFLPSVVAAFALLSPALASANHSSLPIVDLGYELQRATAFNETRGYYNFSSIRYAQAPVGGLRFRAPQAPITNRSVVNDGSVGRICPQVSTTDSSYRDPRETEDCLFLDVIVQKEVFSSAGKKCGGAPVLVWIHGGGYTAGSKAAERTPSGLIDRSISNGSEGAIFVGINYRLGAFGWLQGPSIQENGTANAGLHDQRFALQWVQDNIHLFGGDKNRVTVIGESAGGGSVIHQITAYGGESKAPFQKAIAQSPAWLSFTSQEGQELIFQAFLETANVSSLDEARNLSSAELIAANVQQVVAASATGLSPFQPAVDGDFVPADPKGLLNSGRFDTSVHVMVGHNTNESYTLTPAVTSDAQVDAFIAVALPYASTADQQYVATTLYPPSTNASSAVPYTTPFGRLALIVAEATIVCNAYALASVAAARSPAAYAYLFGVAPGYHGQDVPHTFYDPGAAPYSGDGGIAASWPFNATVALALQDYITGFAVSGRPDSAVDGLDGFVAYGADAQLVSLSGTGIGVQTDAAANERCKWWGSNLVS